MITYHPNRDESYPVEIIKAEPERFRVRVRVTDGRKPFIQHGYFNETSCSDTGWVSASKCKVEPDPTEQTALEADHADWRDLRATEEASRF